MKKDSLQFVSVKGARENNLKNVSVDIPRDAFVVFTGVSGSGKSSLAFGTLYAEAQRRYLESVSPYARRLFNQMEVPEVDEITGLPPAIALQQQRGAPSNRSSVGSVTTLSNLLRMLYSRAGTYPKGQSIIYAEGFSPNTPSGACPQCHGLGRVYDVTEKLMVPDDTKTIRERAIAAWPPAWHGQNLRDMLVTLGFDIDVPWKKLPKKDREWILFTEETPSVPVYAGFTLEEVRHAMKKKMEPSYHGNFSSVRKYVLDTFATTQSALMKKRVSKYLTNALCATCKGKRLKKEALSVKFSDLDIAEMSQLPLKKLLELFSPYANPKSLILKKQTAHHPEQVLAIVRIAEDMVARLHILIDLGLGHLSLERSTPTLSPGELQRMRLATQVRSNLFGVVYVLDEPSAGLHPSDTEALLRAFQKLRDQGNTLFVVEHEIEVMKAADWIVDVGPKAGVHGGEVLYSGIPEGLKKISASSTRKYLFEKSHSAKTHHRVPEHWLRLSQLSKNNIADLDVAFPLGILSTVTGISGSGKSTLVTQLLVDLLAEKIGQRHHSTDELPDLEADEPQKSSGQVGGDFGMISRIIQVDQSPIGRTPRSNIATYTSLFDHVRKIFAATPKAKSKKYGAGHFSFNLPQGRCDNCEGEGFVMVELLFLPSVYTPCPKCHGSRYDEKILQIKYKNKSISEVLDLTVNEAKDFFEEEPQILKSLDVLLEVGLGYLKLGQPATELSGGEAQRIKLATELQRTGRGHILYVLDEPTTGLHPSDVERLMIQLDKLVDAGNSVVVVEHDMSVISRSDWVIDMGPGAGDEGGRVVVEGTPEIVARSKESVTGRYLSTFLN